MNVLSDKATLDEMLTLTKGGRRVPVIVEGSQVTIGYGGS
jgi:hypothetical protein